MDSLTEQRLTSPNLPAPHLEHYSVLHCTMTLDVQTVVVFAVIVVLLLVNVILMFFLGTRWMESSHLSCCELSLWFHPESLRGGKIERDSLRQGKRGRERTSFLTQGGKRFWASTWPRCDMYDVGILSLPKSFVMSCLLNLPVSVVACCLSKIVDKKCFPFKCACLCAFSMWHL